MRQDEAIRREHEALDEISRIGQELDALTRLIFQFGQARYYNPEMVRRLSRAKKRLEDEQEAWRVRRAEYAQFI